MPAVNQRIPNFLGGVSQQPDSIKYPGQLRVCDNAVPDITFGLVKRPPGEFCGKLNNVTTTGYWFEILRDGDEKFIAQITADSNTPIRVWNLNPITVRTADDYYDTISGYTSNGDVIPIGTEMTVNYTNNSYDYLDGMTSRPGVLAIQDYTLVCNPQKTTAKDTDAASPIVSYAKYAFARTETLTYNTEYVLYKGATPPAPTQHYRVTSVRCLYYSSYTDYTNTTLSDSPTFVDAATDEEHGKYDGSLVWSFGGGNQAEIGAKDVVSWNSYTAANTGNAKQVNSEYVDTIKISSINTSIINAQFGSLVHLALTGTNPPEEGDYVVIDRANNGTDVWVRAIGTITNNASGSSAGTMSYACEDVTGTVIVNSINFADTSQAVLEASFDSHSEEQDGDINWDPADFVGWDYDTKYTAVVSLTSGGVIKATSLAEAKKYWIDVKIKDKYYRVQVEDAEPVDTYEGQQGRGTANGLAFYRTPRSANQGALSMTRLLEGLQSSANTWIKNCTAEVIGSGLYLNLNGSSDADSTVSFLGGTINTAMQVIGRTCTNVATLPAECKHGYVVQVSNSEDTESDNYYLKFIADNATAGVGRWEETVRPNDFDGDNEVLVNWNETTMPHALINNRDGTFTFKALDGANSDPNYWKPREVGDNETNPYATILGKKIQHMFFFRNRLGLIADEQVVMSRPSDYFNLWIVSALTTSDDNPIDISMNDIKPAYVRHTLMNATGIMMFSDNGQFILYTESDIFSPKTARLKKISSYETDPEIAPVDLGTTVMFTSDSASHTRAFEARIVDANAPPVILEQTRVVPEFIPKDITVSTNSAAIGIATYGKKDDNKIYHYKYYDTGEKRDQSAWYSWTLQGLLQHCFYSSGSFYSITKQLYGGNTDYILNRYEYVTNIDTSGGSYTVGGENADVGSPLKIARGFEPHLDSMVIIPSSNIAWTAASGSTDAKSTVTQIGYTPTSASNFYAVGLAGTDAEGKVVQAGGVDAASNGTAIFYNLNMSDWTIAVGYQYTTTVELPNYYAANQPGVYDTNADLRINGINLELGVSGPMEFHITCNDTYTDASGNVTKEFDDFTQEESGITSNQSALATVPSDLHKEVRIPIYRKNSKYNLTIKVPDPFYTAIISGSWDGIFNQRRHARK